MQIVDICLCFDINQKIEIVQEIAYGIEEEGLPYRLIETNESDVFENANTAAFQSSLDVGIGISMDKLAIRNSRFEKGVYLFDQDIDKIKDFKAYGANAARLIKGVPFKEI